MTEAIGKPGSFGSRNRFDLDFSSVHKVIQPADVRTTDRLIARIRKRDASETLFEEIRVWRISPLGVELIEGSSSLAFEKGDAVDLELTVGGQRSYFEGLVVDLISEAQEDRIVGIRLARRMSGESASEDRRRSPRWLCSDDFFPTCIALNPGRFDDYVYFQIRDISREGFQLACSLRNKYLIPGMALDLTASFPMVGNAAFSVKITRVGISSEGGKDFLIVGAEFVNVGSHSQQTLAQYLIQFSNGPSAEELRSFGFNPGSISKATDFYFLKTEEDYRAVLQLRLLAHRFEGTISDDTVVADMGDINDTHSRIIVGKFNDQVVATGRIRFNERDVPLEQEQYIEWPASLPMRDQIIEVSRVCTHPEFRKGDLLASLMRHIAATCVRAERPYILIVSLPNMLDFYSRIGFRDTGISHEQKFWNGRQHLMLANGLEMFLGRHSHPFYWNFIWREVAEYMIRNGLIVPLGMDKIRIAIYKLLGPLAKVRFWWARKPRRMK